MEIHDRLQVARRQAGFETYKAAADRFQWSEHTYKSHENGIRGLKHHVAQKYAKAFNVDVAWLLTGKLTDRPNTSHTYTVPVLSNAAGGLWLEDESIESSGEPEIPVITHPDFSKESQYARKVVGNSVSNRIRNGEYAILVRFDSYPGAIPNNTLVCAKRTRPDGLIEYSMKVLKNNRLFTDSAESQDQTELDMGDSEDGTVVEIDGIAIAAHRPFI